MNETLCQENVTNPWDFSPGSICGKKELDTDHDGTADSYGVGWPMKLYRLDSSQQPVLVDETETDAGGSYVFEGLLPGTYFVSEYEDPNYLRLVPAGENKLGPFVVAGVECSYFSGADFLNQKLVSGLTITKTADKECVHVGDKIQYTITVSNPGDVELTNVHVVDAKLGLDYTFPSLAAGASATVPADKTTYVATEADGVKIHNTATASGMSILGPVGPVSASADVCVIHPNITLVKTVQPTEVTVTEAKPEVPVTYTYVITNNGDTPLTVTLSDDKLGPILGAGGLNGGAITLAAWRGQDRRRCRGADQPADPQRGHDSRAWTSSAKRSRTLTTPT